MNPQYGLFKKGSKVKILSTIVTANHYGANPDMERMIGKEYRIQSISSSKEVIKINEWTWRPEDIVLVSDIQETDMKTKIFHFDVKELRL